MADNTYDIPYKHPCTILVSGPTKCGKTRLVRLLIEPVEQLIEPHPQRIIWVYSEWQEEYDRVLKLNPTTEFIHNWNELIYDNLNVEERYLLVIDDQMTEAHDCKTLVKLFTKNSHHRNLTVIYIVQNVFDKGKYSRTISLNSHYHVVFKNRRDETQFKIFATQMLPHHSAWLVDAYSDAVTPDYGYMVIDNKPKTLETHRFRTGIFSDETPAFYSEKK